LFWVDERCVPPSSEASNFGLATHTFLLDVPIPGQNIHRVEGESDNYEHAVATYENVIRSVFNIVPGQVPAFDLIVLGMGSDGHIASILPNTFAQFDTEDLVRAVYKMDGDYNRITLTVPVLLAARRLAVLISGENKAQIVRDVFNSEPDPVRYPVHMLWPVLNKVIWFIDEPAYQMLESPSG
jgi:6-phosphogluconolactonase